MDQHSIEHALADLPIRSIRFYPVIDSTNDEAARWANEGAPELALVIANEQTAGRGRAGRRWYTPAGTSLAFSLVLYPPNQDASVPQQLTALGALAVQKVLKECYFLPAQIKWPNDVLIDGYKVAGVLAEAHWIGDQLSTVILGIGINIASPSTIQVSTKISDLSLPVTCVQDAAGQPVERLSVLHDVMREMLIWYPQLGTQEFLQAWEAALAFRGEWVVIAQNSKNETKTSQGPAPLILQGKIIGLARDGGLMLNLPGGDILTLHNGDVSIRPVT